MKLAGRFARQVSRQCTAPRLSKCYLLGGNMEYNFSHMTDIELVVMQKDLRKCPEDKDFLNAVLEELGKRQAKITSHSSGRQEDGAA